MGRPHAAIWSLRAMLGPDSRLRSPLSNSPHAAGDRQDARKTTTSKEKTCFEGQNCVLFVNPRFDELEPTLGRPRGLLDCR
jgi:hypothetical protein